MQPRAKVVVLVPTVSLVRQHCTAYEKAGFRPAGGSAAAPPATGMSPAGSGPPQGSPQQQGGRAQGAAQTSRPAVTQLPWVVDWYCGDKPLPGEQWRGELGRVSVMVWEAQSFYRLLEKGHARLSDIQLLVCVGTFLGVDPCAQVTGSVQALSTVSWQSPANGTASFASACVWSCSNACMRHCTHGTFETAPPPLCNYFLCPSLPGAGRVPPHG